VTCTSPKQKSVLLQMTEWNGKTISVTEPWSKSCRNGADKSRAGARSVRGIIFGVSTELTDADIVSETGALAARRLTRRVEGENKPTGNVVINFPETLPSTVCIGYLRYRVKPDLASLLCPTDAYNRRLQTLRNSLCRSKAYRRQLQRCQVVLHRARSDDLRPAADNIDSWMVEPLCSVSRALDIGQEGNVTPPTTELPHHAASALVATKPPSAVAVDTSSSVSPGGHRHGGHYAVAPVLPVDGGLFQTVPDYYNAIVALMTPSPPAYTVLKTPLCRSVESFRQQLAQPSGYASTCHEY